MSGNVDENPAWSPDGTRIAFSHQGQDLTPFDVGIWSIDPNGANPRQLTNDYATHDYEPDWQPISAPVAEEIGVTADAGGPYAVDEGGELTLDGSSSSPAMVSYLWDLDGDGVYDDASGATVSTTFGENGTYLVGLEITDQLGRIATARATVNVHNTPPVIRPAVAFLDEKGLLRLSVDFTDAGAQDKHEASVDWGDGTGMEAASILVANGYSSVTSAHVYDPRAAAHTVTVTITDDDGASASSSTVTIKAPLNHRPSVQDRSLTVTQGEALAIRLVASDPDGDTLTYSLLEQPMHGTVTVLPNESPPPGNPNLLYSPDPDYSGLDDFTLTAYDGKEESNAATVSIRVVAGTGVPVAHGGAVITAEDSSKAISLQAIDPDRDALAYAIEAGPSHGKISILGNRVRYAPAANYHGVDSFTFTASDGAFRSNAATVSIRVTAVNDPPDGSAVTASPAALWPPNRRFVLVTLGGATDVDGDDVAVVVNAVTQDEALTGGRPNGKWAAEPDQVYLMAARRDSGDGRVYRVSFTASDGHGGVYQGVRLVGVPHDQRSGSVADESPPVINTFEQVPIGGVNTGAGGTASLAKARPEDPSDVSHLARFQSLGAGSSLLKLGSTALRGLFDNAFEFGGQLATRRADFVPTRVSIPAISLSSRLVPLGLNHNGSLEVPTEHGVAGWYNRGPVPGDHGPAVIAGHVDSKSGPAVFFRLHDLTVGDIIMVWNKEGLITRFEVQRVKWYTKAEFPTEKVYSPTRTRALRLITCGGRFDFSSGHYLDNVVVYATMAALQ